MESELGILVNKFFERSTVSAANGMDSRSLSFKEVNSFDETSNVRVFTFCEDTVISVFFNGETGLLPLFILF